METPKPQQGTWTLTAPDGRTWQADSPLRACSLEQRERVPAEVALARVLEVANEPDFAERPQAVRWNDLLCVGGGNAEKS